MIDFGMNPEGLAALGVRLTGEAETARSAVTDFDAANTQLTSAVKHPVLANGFSRLGSQWWRLGALVPSEAAGLGHAVVAAAATGVAADDQSAADQSAAVSLSAATSPLLRKSINAM